MVVNPGSPASPVESVARDSGQNSKLAVESRTDISSLHTLHLQVLTYAEFVYLDLEKTGCTFLRQMLKTICAGALLEDSKHDPIAAMTGTPRVMTIRHPLPYFLSLWKYGLEGQGAFYNFYRESHPLAYADRTRRSFRFFLNLALTESRLGVCGQAMTTDIYTLRIVNQLVPLQDRDDVSRNLAGDLSPRSLIRNLEGFFPSILIRTESLNRDFHALADAGRLNFMNLRQDWKTTFPLDAEKTNASSGETADEVSYYYDDWHREKVLFESGLALRLYDLASEAVP